MPNSTEDMMLKILSNALGAWQNYLSYKDKKGEDLTVEEAAALSALLIKTSTVIGVV